MTISIVLAKLVVFSSLLPPDLSPFADVCRGGDGDSDHPVFPDPLVLNVELHGELRYFSAEGVGELHGAAWGVRHRAG
ncbi:hypothetical protein HW555_006428 [Spodoptera exigua]|uniref:Secreted protein n=1 Tax=Spodoptera exigua TaxID=7107 RepID=A0A835GIQ5_SPOEX|nr:hypothetical protein HW555_006428 [Spodoptera exigua]